jgi:nitric oxide dioxygenase
VVTAETIRVIKMTVPVLAAHGETLTRHFYRRMFEGNPEVKAFFNPAHQHSGGQQRALAAAICAYAENIERPAALAGAVELIAQKHASLGVRPEHYPIVGKHLLASIREVLGAAATDEIIDAWAAAYGVLADILIAREAEIYKEHREGHGWEGFGEFVVQRKVRESSVVTSFYLVPAGGSAVKPFKAGQYVTVRVAGADGGTTMRNYSLSCRSGEGYYRISVKREVGRTAETPGGHVSNYLHDQVREGDRLEVGPPCGEFTLEEKVGERRPLVLVSGGVGVTPVLAMLHAAVARGGDREIVFVHAALNGETHAFRREVLGVADANPRVRVHFRYSQATRECRERELCDSEGLVDGALLKELAGGADARFYVCGPKPFMAGVYRELMGMGVKAGDVRYEFFGPMQGLKEEAVAV